MPTTPGFEYLRSVDFESLKPLADSGELAMQPILGRDSGAVTCMISAVIKGPGKGRPLVFTPTKFDKAFFIAEGTANIQIEDDVFEAKAGDFVLFPAGVRHRNWNASGDYVKILSFITPLPDPEKPLAKPV